MRSLTDRHMILFKYYICIFPYHFEANTCKRSKTPEPKQTRQRVQEFDVPPGVEPLVNVSVIKVIVFGIGSDF